MAAAGSSGASKRLVQYVVVRSDLIHTLSWPLGAVITQACHAATAAIHSNYSDPDTQEYLSDLEHMHKVVLQTADEASLTQLSCTLRENGITHTLWTEQPENVATCLALKPYPKNIVQPFIRKLQLFK
ncbi:putative peptidyl-tRNA hydrolase PTRHD1 [Bagarius yarrelli]|uniref:peptidyl-tRNA hydrolase n=1 Tax=Bagarius yarrelli TaxID=175774 RepID=A0A556TZQ0_BAGYA|nr:putative peptidyl-tRNA hydrolase PTRHD1 [Bagarius yarrelli]